MTGRLAGKVALITGASRGIGAACAELFARHGAKVAIIDLAQTADEGTKLAEKIGNARFFACDVTSAEDCARAVAEAADALGPINVLVNNAGIAIEGGLEELSEADWDRIFSVNVKSIFLMGRHVLPMMRRSGGGSIVNIASESAFIGFPMHPAYCASKAAVVHLSRSLAVRHAGENIRVNALCPGTINTRLYRDFIDSLEDRDAVEKAIIDMHPLGIGEPDDIANAALFLASDESRYMTGAPMLVDGGAVAK